jgi:hypothetical protein
MKLDITHELIARDVAQRMACARIHCRAGGLLSLAHPKPTPRDLAAARRAVALLVDAGYYLTSLNPKEQMTAPMRAQIREGRAARRVKLCTRA